MHLRTVLAGAAAAAIMQQPQQIAIDGGSLCAGCTVELEKIATLGKDTDPVDISGPAGFGIVAPVRDARGRFFTAVRGGLQVGVYDSAGALQGVVNASAGGGGGASAVSVLAMGINDSLYLGSGARVLVLSPNLVYVRTVELPRYHSLVAAPSSGGIIAQVSLSANEKAFPLSAIAPGGRLPRGFGSADSLPVGDCVTCEQRNSIIAHDREFVWVSRRNEYLAEAWTDAGVVRATVRVTNSQWFESWTAPAADPNPLDTKPRTSIVGAWSPAPDRLWVVATAPRSDWRPFDGQRSQGVVVLGSRAVIRPELLTDLERSYLAGNVATVVELLDTRDRKVLGSARFDGARLLPMGGDLVYSVSSTPGGANSIDIFRLRLKTN